MTDRSTGGPAFPLNVNHKWFEGMTLRDYFAAAAMQGWCSMTQSSDWTEEELARDAYVIADAMLAAREAQ